MEQLWPVKGESFRTAVANLIANHQYIDAAVSHMDTEQVEILLEELAKAENGLRQVNLPLHDHDVSMNHIVDSLSAMRKSNPEVKTELRFIGRKISLEEGQMLGENLSNTAVSSLVLDSTMSPEGAPAIISNISNSQVEKLEVTGTNVEKCADSVVDALQVLKEVHLSEFAVSNETHQRIDAAHTNMNQLNKNQLLKWNDPAAEIGSTDNVFAQAQLIHDDRAFQTEAVNLIDRNKSLNFILVRLHPDQTKCVERMKSVLTELGKNERGHLNIVNLQLSSAPAHGLGFTKDNLPIDDISHALLDLSENHPNVKTNLMLNDASIDQHRARVIAETIQKARLLDLQLDNCMSDAESTRMIVGALSKSTVRTVSLCGNVFDDESVKMLIDSLGKLRRVELSASSFSAEQQHVINEAKRNHPNCEINWY